ncbi:MAG: zinc ribbon domain-containing protein [Cellulosilyticaceae bacterium]
MENMKYCQSCGMPMNDAVYGTNEDGSKNEMYCTYCYQKGAFTAEVTMNEMIEICIPFMLEDNRNLTEEATRKMLQEIFPKLKRWE